MYLFSDTPENVLPKDQSLFRIQQNMKDYLQTEMEYLALFPASEKKGKNIYLRHLLANIIYSIIIPTTEKQVATPVWFRKTLEELKRQDTLSEGLPAIVSRTGLSEAHICRTFKRYLGMTPTQYINTMRLNYIANMLVHSDRPIKDLAEKSGFSSFSYFYSQFKKKFSTPPAEYRKSHFGQRSKFQKLG